MTVQNHTSPLYTMNAQAGAALLKEINKAMQNVQVSTIKKPKHPFAPRGKADDAAFGGAMDGSMLGNMLGTMFLDMLFGGGMPMLQGMSEAAHGLGQIGLMNAVENDRDIYARQSRYAEPAPRVTSFDEVVRASEQREYLQAVASQKSKMRQMAMLRQMMIMLLAQMMEQQEEGGKQGGDSEGLVMDVLREPKLARFKQNRQSISCIRTLFTRQSTIVAPKYSAPSYGFAA